MGVTIGTILGIGMGLLIGLNQTVDRMLGPLINFLFAIVEVAWIPIFVLRWGYGIRTNPCRTLLRRLLSRALQHNTWRAPGATAVGERRPLAGRDARAGVDAGGASLGAS